MQVRYNLSSWFFFTADPSAGGIFVELIDKLFSTERNVSNNTENVSKTDKKRTSHLLPSSILHIFDKIGI